MEVITLPVEKWQEYRALRLRALKEDQQAFSSSYAESLAQPEAFWKGRLAEAAQAKRSWLLFAREGARLCGMIGAFLEEEPTDTATIVSVYVPQEARGKGIAALLMEAILLRLSDSPSLSSVKLSVNVTQLPAIQIYRRFGFREFAVQPSTTGAGKAVSQLVMQRDLPFRGQASTNPAER